MTFSPIFNFVPKSNLIHFKVVEVMMGLVRDIGLK